MFGPIPKSHRHEPDVVDSGREVLTIMIAFQNKDDFIRNLCTIRGELRAALAIPLPGGLVKGSLTGTTAASASIKK
jgi:hypothetical protein